MILRRDSQQVKRLSLRLGLDGPQPLRFNRLRRTAIPTLLHIDSSPRSTSVTSKLSAAFATEWKKRNPRGTVIHHNTTLEKLPFVDELTVGAFFTPEAELTAEHKHQLQLSDQLVDELIAADVVALGIPMWNLGVPASFKAWVDLIVRAGRTFNFTAKGVVSLLPPGKKVYVFTARGGAYAEGTPSKAFDQQEPYLRMLFGFLGVTNLTFIHADNQSREPEVAAAGMAKAECALAALPF